jgi:hypothetical protein
LLAVKINTTAPRIPAPNPCLKKADNVEEKIGIAELGKISETTTNNLSTKPSSPPSNLAAIESAIRSTGNKD